MRDDWHVYNLKRRIASLPPISVTEFRSKVLPSRDTAKGSSIYPRSCDACGEHYTSRKAWQAHLKSQHDNKTTVEYSSEDSGSRDEISSPSKIPLGRNEQVALDEDEEEEIFNPVQCLFCNTKSSSLDSNMTHMSHAHNFFIPDAEHLIDLESFLSYLFAIVSAFHECLFCGSVRSTKLGVQDHMRGKGHCKLDFEDEEQEFRLFYNFSGSDEDEGEEKTIHVPLRVEDELHLTSGKILGRRLRARHFRRVFHHQPQATLEQPPTEPESTVLPPESKGRSLGIRDGTSTSLVGVPELQQRALMAVEKKILKVETIARKEYEARVERGGNRQKRYKVAGMGKKQGGLEKRLG